MRLGWKKLAGVALAGLLLLLVGYCYFAWRDATMDSMALRIEAARLEKAGLGSSQLGKEKLALLLRVEDPTFWTNNGTDFSTPGAGHTTITQSLAKRTAFAQFRPGIRKLRQTIYAIGLTRNLTKAEILTLFLAKTPFKASDGAWVTGFDAASRRFFGRPVAAIDQDQFTLLVGSGIAPGELWADRPTPKLLERARRIKILEAGACTPQDHGDVMLEGCAFRQ